MKNILLVWATVWLVSACWSWNSEPLELEPWNAVITTQKWVRKVISCDNPTIHPICKETGTDDIPQDS